MYFIIRQAINLPDHRCVHTIYKAAKCVFVLFFLAEVSSSGNPVYIPDTIIVLFFFFFYSVMDSVFKM